MPTYGATSCRLEILSASRIPLQHLGIKSKSANTKTINDNTPAIDIHTTLLVLFLVLLEFVSSGLDGPSAFFPGDCPDGGAPASYGAGGWVGGDVGEGSGELVVLNGFPSFLLDKNQN